MTCRDAIRFLSPYMDSELDPRTSFEIAEHLERCPSCAERFALEIRLEKAVARALRGDPARDCARGRALAGRVEAAIRAEAAEAAEAEGAPAWSGWLRGVARRRRRALAPALLGLALGAALLYAGARGGAPLGALGQAACGSHHAYAAAAEAPELTTASPEEVARFFARTLGLDVRPPAPSLVRTVGARRCAFGKTHVAFVMGRRGDEPVSAFVFPASDLDAFPEARRALEAGGGRARARIDGHAAALATDGERVAFVLASPAAGPLEAIALAYLSEE